MRKKLITSFHCDCIKCSCGALIVIKSKSSILTSCNKCGSLYGSTGTKVMEGISLENNHNLIESSNNNDNTITN